MHSSQIMLLGYSFTLMPHYTIAFKPLFEFIVLGMIPGTSIQLGVNEVIIVCLLVFLVSLMALYRPERINREPFSTIYDISL